MARPTYARVRSRDNKPICKGCFVPCDPKSREYRALTLCEECYGYEPLIIQKKELLCKAT